MWRKMILASRGHRRSWLKLLVAAVLVSSFAGEVCYACWQQLVMECFMRPATQWPWTNPLGSGRQWRHYPNDPQLHWGINTDVFNNAICSPGPPYSSQSCWCIGDPVGQDPEFDQYPNNLNTYVTYGPCNLTNAEDASVFFYLFSRAEVGHDSVFWGAATSFTLTPQNMMVGGSRSEDTFGDDFMIVEFFLDNLHPYQFPDSTVSLIGQPAVYVFWRFVSDGDNIRDMGAFIDEVIISYDDGGTDLMTGGSEFIHTDSTGFSIEPALGDTLALRFGWSVCDGGSIACDTFRLLGVLLRDDAVIDTVFDSVMVDTPPASSHEMYTEWWVNDTPGTYTVLVKLDTLEQCGEVSETNNTVLRSYTVLPPNYPPEFYWTHPIEDTLWAHEVADLSWFCFDSLEDATVTIVYDQNNFGCSGVTLPGGLNRPAIGWDTLNWPTEVLPEGREYWIFARVQDAANELCVYAPYPIFIRHLDVARPLGGAIPERFYLAQNYPNPFNPQTEIEYGVNIAGEVRLTVYDLLGREVAQVVNELHPPGNYAVSFDGSNLATGVYLYRLTTPEGTLIQKMMLLK